MESNWLLGERWMDVNNDECVDRRYPSSHRTSPFHFFSHLSQKWPDCWFSLSVAKTKTAYLKKSEISHVAFAFINNRELNVNSWQTCAIYEPVLIVLRKRFQGTISREKYSPKCPPNVEAHGVQPEKCRQKEELRWDRWKRETNSKISVSTSRYSRSPYAHSRIIT